MASRLSYFESSKESVQDNENTLISCGRRNPHCWTLMEANQAGTPFGSYPEEDKSLLGDERASLGSERAEVPVQVAARKKGSATPSAPLGSTASMEEDANQALQSALAPHLVHLQNANGNTDLKLMARIGNDGIRIVPGVSGSGTRVWRRRGLLERWMRHWFMPWAHD